MLTEIIIDLESVGHTVATRKAADELWDSEQSDESLTASYQRHWLLDVDAGRDLLKVAARKYAPEKGVPLLSNSPVFDPVLNTMIDRLQLRELKEPETALAMALMNYKLAARMLRLQFPFF